MTIPISTYPWLFSKSFVLDCLPKSKAYVYDIASTLIDLVRSHAFLVMMPDQSGYAFFHAGDEFKCGPIGNKTPQIDVFKFSTEAETSMTQFRKICTTTMPEIKESSGISAWLMNVLSGGCDCSVWAEFQSRVEIEPDAIQCEGYGI